MRLFYEIKIMNDELMKYLLVAALILFAFIPVTLNALKRRKENPPPMAANDRKLYRLWRSDPEAYQRQYGDMDKQYLAAQKAKGDKH
ncbi:MAG: MFS transporter [Neptuniibacter sp.]|nr:MFS transporter [Neptuniibacter sp.]